ncbi:MAG: hypothetical protein IT558_00220 [Alphaproteobacteria bacterium]|nr:hypothetical protein [Alphaproteobacteria bacterium]
MQKRQQTILWAIILSESSHIFCCVLPTLFSLFGILANIGLFVMPAGFVFLHEAMHKWEFPIVLFSGAVIVLGWGLHWHSLRGEECPSGCQHHTDKQHPTVSKTHLILKIATLLFAVNLFVFLVVHRGLGVFAG